MVGKHDTTFHADGTATHRMGFRAKWWCDDGQLHIEWSDGRPGPVRLSANGKQIVGLDGGVHMSRD